MARKQGPEEKYYPQVWRFLRRCTSPLPTPREGNTFASRNGLSNRFSHMDQLQFLRHRYARIPGENGMNSTPAAAGRKESQEAVRPPAQRRKQRCHSPFRRRSRAESPVSPTGVERRLKVTKRQHMRWNIASGMSSPAGLSSRPDSPRVKRKKESPAVMTRDNRELNGGRFSRNASRRSRRGNANGPIPSGCIPDTDASRSGGRCCLRIPTGNASLAGR